MLNAKILYESSKNKKSVFAQFSKGSDPSNYIKTKSKTTVTAHKSAVCNMLDTIFLKNVLTINGINVEGVRFVLKQV